MEIKPIFSSLSHNRTGPIIISIQLALTLALMVNAMTTVSNLIEKINKPLGIDVENIYSFNSAFQSVHNINESFLKNDLSQIRNIHGVIDATLVQSFPPFGLGEKYRNSKDNNGEYFHYVTTNQIDEHGLNALGIKILAGRNFRSDEIVYSQNNELQETTAVIITEDLSGSLFPGVKPENIIGEFIYNSKNNNPVEIIGIVYNVANMILVFEGAEQNQKNGYHYLFKPAVSPVSDGGYNYIVRTTPEQQFHLVNEIDDTLIATNPNRLIYQPVVYTDYIKRLFSFQTAMATVLASISLLMIIISGLGIVGLSSYTVNERQHHIGIRRALGASQWNIMRYFLLESFLITTLSIFLGVCLVLMIHIISYKNIGDTTLNIKFLFIGITFIYCLGFLAVYMPAKRAASISPIMATKAV